MKKIICLCMSLAFVAVMMISCNKECVCTKTITTSALVDSVVTPTTKTDVYHGGNIYDKRECEALNGSDSTSTEVVSFTCAWEKKSK